MPIDPNAFRAAREKIDISQGVLAKRVGIGQSTIDKIERGLTRSSKFLPRIAQVLGVSISELDRDFEPPKEGYRPPPVILGERDLPVYSATEGGPGEMVVSADPIEVVPRPWFMKDVTQGYAVLVVGESMEPAFEPGDMAIVNPRLPAARNKTTIFVSGEDRGEFKATIKRLLGWTQTHWKVRQFNEPRDFELARDVWPKALRVVGKLEGG